MHPSLLLLLYSSFVGPEASASLAASRPLRGAPVLESCGLTLCFWRFWTRTFLLWSFSDCTLCLDPLIFFCCSVSTSIKKSKGSRLHPSFAPRPASVFDVFHRLFVLSGALERGRGRIPFCARLHVFFTRHLPKRRGEDDGTHLLTDEEARAKGSDGAGRGVGASTARSRR